MRAITADIISIPMSHHTSISSHQNDLNGRYTISQSHIDFLNEQGYIKLKQVLSPSTIKHYGRVITEQVRLLNPLTVPMAERSTYQKAFLQVQNIWTKDETVKQFAFASKLARIAAELLAVSGVRMYHDQALYKEPGGGITPWHADQYYWPLDSDRTITAWIPLQAIPLEMGPLAFARKTHRMSFGRDLAISDESENLINKSLKEAQADIDETPFDMGEISFHLGWTFHRAGANQSDAPRAVMTMIYVDEDIRLLDPKTKAHRRDQELWCPEVDVDQVLDGPLNPILWTSRD